MSRYIRNKPKKPASPDILMPVVVTALIIAVIGGYFVVEWIKQFSITPEVFPENSKTVSIPVGETYPYLQAQIKNSQPVILPPRPGRVSENTTQPSRNQTDLPNLLDSDVLVRQELAKISPGMLPWLSADQLIRRYMLVVNDFAQSQRIAVHMSFIRLDEPFLVDMIGNDLFISAKCYQRYNRLVQALQAINANVAIKFYKQIRPLMLLVYSEFGYPKDITLEAILKKAVAQILAAPVLEGQVGLVRPSLYYKFADSKLELLNPVQKQMLRMGPENTRIVQAKLREFMAVLAKTEIRQ
jgi:hypothetical protein